MASKKTSQAGNHQYGLRQRRVEIPIEVQLQHDDVFLSQYAATADHLEQDEYNYDSSSDLVLGQTARSSSSGSDSDGSHELNHIVGRRHNKNTSERGELTIPKQTCTTDQVDQSVVNEQILVQLQAIGHRLDTIERGQSSIEKRDSKSHKGKSKRVKTDNKLTPGSSANSAASSALPPSTAISQPALPSLASMRSKMHIQQQVEQRLKEITELSTSGNENKLKSQRGGVEVFVKNKIRWPHEFVLAGNTKERISYNQLNVLQWMAGFCRTMKEENDIEIRNHMLEYVIALLDDAQDFSWQAAKASHAVLLCCMEQGEVASWSDSEKIDRIRRANAQKHVQGTSSPSQFQANRRPYQPAHKSTKTMPCTYYNEGKCKFQKSHETAGIFFRHICATCMAVDGKSNSHPELDCRNRNKQFQSKNE